MNDLRRLSEPLQIATPKIVAVLGAGQWVRRAYAPTLEFLQDRGMCATYFAYDGRFGSPAGRADTAANVAYFERWGATCLDIAEKENRARLEALSAHAVFVVTPDHTHCDAAEAWLGRAESIYVEKPFDVDSEKIRRLLLKPHSEQIWGFDHYLIRANQFTLMEDYLRLSDHLEGRIARFVFHMLEPSDDGLKERQHSIQGGMVMDMGSHVLALVIPFGDPRTVRLQSVKAGVYSQSKDVESDGREIFSKGRESFAEVRFRFTSIFGDQVDAIARVGKCVDRWPDKALEIIGGREGDRRIRLDFDACTVHCDGGAFPGPRAPLYHEPVAFMIREVVAGMGAAPVAVFAAEKGQDIVERLTGWTTPIRQAVKGGRRLETYPGGAPLEEILERLPVL